MDVQGPVWLSVAKDGPGWPWTAQDGPERESNKCPTTAKKKPACCAQRSAAAQRMWPTDSKSTPRDFKDSPGQVTRLLPEAPLQNGGHRGDSTKKAAPTAPLLLCFVDLGSS